jgi:hypothetical protein
VDRWPLVVWRRSRHHAAGVGPLTEAWQDSSVALLILLHLHICTSAYFHIYPSAHYPINLCSTKNPFSVIGAGVWCIILGMVAAGTKSETALGILYLFLFGLFTAIALAALYAKRSKVLAGILLNWHIYMIPTVFLAIAFLIVYSYNHAPHLYGVYDSVRHCMDYPIGCWVENNFEIIAWGNLFFSLLYTGFIFNRLAEKWHIMPDE